MCCLPPQDGFCVTVRVRVWLPPPQVAVQVEYGDQFETAQLIGQQLVLPGNKTSCKQGDEEQSSQVTDRLLELVRGQRLESARTNMDRYYYIYMCAVALTVLRLRQRWACRSAVGWLRYHGSRPRLRSSATCGSALRERSPVAHDAVLDRLTGRVQKGANVKQASKGEGKRKRKRKQREPCPFLPLVDTKLGLGPA